MSNLDANLKDLEHDLLQKSEVGQYSVSNIIFQAFISVGHGTANKIDYFTSLTPQITGSEWT